MGLYVAEPIIINVEPHSTLGAHRMTHLTDALAVYELISKLDPSIDIPTIGELVATASEQEGNTLEQLVSDIGAVFGEPFPGTETIRDTLYQNIYKLAKENVLFSQAAGLVSIESLSDNDATSLASLAQSHIAYRYALQQLTPFAVTGDDSSMPSTTTQFLRCVRYLGIPTAHIARDTVRCPIACKESALSKC